MARETEQRSLTVILETIICMLLEVFFNFDTPSDNNFCVPLSFSMSAPVSAIPPLILSTSWMTVFRALLLGWATAFWITCTVLFILVTWMNETNPRLLLHSVNTYCNKVKTNWFAVELTAFRITCTVIIMPVTWMNETTKLLLSLKFLYDTLVRN